ncbi:2-methylfumaryl-CoA isomerase [Halopolyspora algeriensis]|uniref:2-methylfumaryl-CoA isomerase n=1 Tax=Halopolyspora algeriensis TaxID=1500506 RepID=A0A368VUJ3_9ACTN|nr:CoA transferase [Halopolyspora algeriensis]RCW45754.1 2-methylfumaryl-CoA isomerase [Halopolyspora algeriensis]TQM54138.1 2-methylfumaryl-CoA isomerase [Halopolyspora algeriensis]
MPHSGDPHADGSHAHQPLDGLQVVECSTFVAGPSGGMALARMGADVIRIDPVGGAADHRRLPLAEDGGSLYWTGLNKGKRSITVDLRSEQGRELASALITRPGPDRGIFLNNAPDHGWTSHKNLSRRRADLIHLRIQGHSDGRPAVDYTVNAEMGVPEWTGPSEHAAPVNHVLPAWDLLTGMTAVSGLLAALRDRDRNGHGRYIELALADVALSALGDLGWLAETQLSGQERPRHGNYLYGTFGCDFPTADAGRVMIVALTTAQWHALTEVTGTSTVFTELEASLGTELASEEGRYRHRETIAAILRPWFAGRTIDDITTAFGGTRVLWSRYRGVSDVAAEAAAGEAGPLAGEVDQPEVGPVLATGSPLRWSGTGLCPTPAPALGEHTEEVLCGGLGLTQLEFGRLRDAGIVGGRE